MECNDYQFHHDEMLQNHNLKITALEAELGFKKEKLDDLKRDNERMEKKIDEIKNSVNEIILASKKGDDELDKRLLKIETNIKTQKEEHDRYQKENKEEFNRKLSVITIIFGVLTFYFNFVHPLTL